MISPENDAKRVGVSPEFPNPDLRLQERVWFDLTEADWVDRLTFPSGLAQAFYHVDAVFQSMPDITELAAGVLAVA
jgi:hypothetical protein